MNHRIEIRSDHYGPYSVVTTITDAEGFTPRALCLEVSKAIEANKEISRSLEPLRIRERADEAVQSVNHELNWLRENGFAVPSNIAVEQKQAMQIEHKETPNGE